MPAINIADIQIVLQTVQTTQPALKFMDSSGNLYYAEAHLGACAESLVVGDGDASWTIGKSTLVYEATKFDSCEKVSLSPGCYSVVVMGGKGGAGGNNGDEGSVTTEEYLSFNLYQTTDVYLLRGSDGKAGGVNSSGGLYSGGGGGASGVPSFFAVDGKYIISQGGTGGTGAVATKSDGTAQDCAAGGGGGISGAQSGKGSVGADAWDANGFVCGAGGGGSLGGKGGDKSSGFLYNGSAGLDATDTSGGDGGSSSIGGLLGTSSSSGGAGGANVAYSCGGQTFYSYGGGGGGGASMGGLFGIGVNANGGVGGSGGIGSSSTSYVKIYRLGL